MLNGINIHPAWQEQSDPAVRNELLGYIAEAGFDFVRIDYAWATIEPNKGQFNFSQLDTFVSEAADHGLQALLMLYWPPAWSSGSGAKNAVPGNPEDFGRAVGETAKHFGDRVLAIEMFNEPDIDTFWTGTADQFSNLLVEAYPVAKAMAPNTVLLAAAPTYLGLASGWFESMYSNPNYRPELAYDAQAIHPYMSPSDLPPTAPSSDWSMRGIVELEELRASFDDYSNLWATEYGWSTHENEAGAANWKLGITEQEQAYYVVAGTLMCEIQGLAASCLYTERDMIQTTEPHERNFGLMRTDNSWKPAMAAMKALLTATAPEPPDPPDSTALEDRVLVVENKLALLAQNLRLAADGLE